MLLQLLPSTPFQMPPPPSRQREVGVYRGWQACTRERAQYYFFLMSYLQRLGVSRLFVLELLLFALLELLRLLFTPRVEFLLELTLLRSFFRF